LGRFVYFYGMKFANIKKKVYFCRLIFDVTKTNGDNKEGLDFNHDRPHWFSF